MSIKDVIKKDIKEFKILTPVIIVCLLLITVSIFSVRYFINISEDNAVKLFERAYLKIADFDELSFFEKEKIAPDIVKQLDRVISKFPNSNSASRALFYKGYVLFHSEKYEDAEKVFLDFLKKHKNNYLTGKAYYFLAYCYSEKKDFQKAIDTLKVFEKELHDSSFAPTAYYKIGFCYEQMNDKDNAVKYYQKIIDEFKESEIKDFATKKLYLIKNDVKLTEKKYF